MRPEGNRPLPVDEVAMGSRPTHALLEAYLKGWTHHVASDRKEDAPSLDIYDLFAGTGWCVEREHGKEEWPGTALIAAGALREYPSRRPCHLYLNSWAKDTVRRDASRAALRTRIESLELSRPDRPISYWSGPLSAVVPDALAEHSERGRHPSLWVLDPSAASDLPWGAVRAVASHERAYRDRSGEIRRRRPELFIHFLAGELQQNMGDLPMLTEVLGCSETEWSSHLAEVGRGGGSVLDALTTFYVRQLEGAYGRRPFVVSVGGESGRSDSMIFLVVERDATWHSIRGEPIALLENTRWGTYEPRPEWVRAAPPAERQGPQGQKPQAFEDLSP